MKLKDIYNTNKPVISFEIFPPKADAQDYNGKVESLFSELKVLSKYNPTFISVTYGAGGSTRDKTLELVIKIKKELNLLPTPHFTCVGASKAEILEYVKEVENAGIENIVALRGDPPKGQDFFVKPKDGFGYANELVEFIKTNTNLGIAVAGYPEVHPEAESAKDDLINLKRKIDAGADAVITQVFFDNSYYFEFVEKAQKAGINVPIVPGILPVTNIAQIERMVAMSGTKIPENLTNSLKKFENYPDAIKKLGVEFAIKQCKELLKNDIPGIHFYPLNRSFATDCVLKELNINYTIKN
ncbi:MAG: methylenetetrahydrofolate reductase [NAD(P)H] [Candidatus Gastranaerophilales bacterium]|nr:methylenetetrahydrofolate reductase [NAD(P)H] [Candidatus Gastranaerophilales bacterium]